MLTQWLVSISNGLIPEPIEEESVFDGSENYSMFDSGSVEIEVAEFLYGLARVAKPKNVLTTGAYHGISDLYIASALKKNGFGKIVSLEYEEQHIATSQKLWDTTGVSDIIDCVYTWSLDYTPKVEFDMIFLDTEPQIRFKELERFLFFVNPGGFIILHDLQRGLSQDYDDNTGEFTGPFGKLPSVIENGLHQGSLTKFNLPSPRGCTIFVRQHERDY